MEILIKPILPTLKWLCMYYVHKSQQKILCLEEEVEVSKYQLRISAVRQKTHVYDMYSEYVVSYI